MSIILELFLTFFKIGLFTFGGGYAMIPVVEAEVVPKWLTGEMFMNIIAVAESTPGPIAINMATFIGSSQGGFWGALLATLGVVLPSFIIIILIAAVITGLMKFAGVKAFLSGIRPVVVGLIIATAVGMIISVILGLDSIGQAVAFDWKALVIFGIVAITHFVLKKVTKKAPSPIILIILSALLGMLFYGVL